MSISSENVFTRETANCFSNTDLMDFINTNHLSEFEIIGVDGNSCIAISALKGAKLGYNIQLNSDCIGIANISKFKDTKEKLRMNGVEII